MRDIAAEIRDIKSRYRQKKLSQRAMSEISEILRSLERMPPRTSPVKKKDKITLTFHVVRSVAVYQTIFRQIVASYIDSKPDCLPRLSKLKDVKITFDHLFHFFTEKFSAGEYVAHFTTLNGLDDLLSYGGMLLDRDIRPELMKEIKRDDTSEEAKKDFESLLRETADLFSLRHELCHEAGFPKGFTYARVTFALSSSVSVMMAAVVILERSRNA